MPPVKAQVQDGQLILSLPQDAVLLEQAVQLLELFLAAMPQERSACLDALEQTADAPPLSADQNRYIALIQRGLQQRDEQAMRFAEADLFALDEAERLGIKLTARQRNTLIQYYVERHPPDEDLQPTGGSSSEAALARARVLAERMRRKR